MASFTTINNTLPSSSNTSPLRRIEISRPKPGQITLINASTAAYLNFGFNPGEHRAVAVGKNLVIEFNDGGKIILAGLFASPPSETPTVALPDGRVYSILDFLESLQLVPKESTPTTHADHTSGLPAYQDDPGELVGDLPRLGMLGTIYWEYTYERDEIFQGNWLFNNSVPDPDRPDGSFDFVVTTLGTSGLYEDDQPEKYRFEQKDLPHPVAGRLDFDYETNNGTQVTAIHMSGFNPGTQVYIGDPFHGGTLFTPDASGVYTFNPGDFSEPGIFLIPPFNDDTNMYITVQLDLMSGTETATVTDGFVIIVDAVADKPVDVAVNAEDPEMQGSLAIDDTGIEEQFASGWAEKDITKNTGEDDSQTKEDQEDNTSDSGVSVSIPLTLEAQFFDFDGSETHTLYLKVPSGEGWTCTVNGQELQIVDGLPGLENADSFYFFLPQSLLTFDADGKVSINALLQNNRPDGLLSADFEESLTLVAIALEHPTDEELTDRNNEAITINTSTVTLDSVSSGLAVKVGWASEGGDGSRYGGEYAPSASAPGYAAATDGGEYARIGIGLSAPQGNGETAQGENITLIIISCDPTLGTLVDSNGAPLPLDGQGRAVLSGPEYISADGQSLVPGSVLFKPADNYSDADLGSAIKYAVTVTASSGASAVFSGSSTVVIDAVADRPDIEALSADYGSNGNNDFTAVTPGGVVSVSGSASFHDLDGSELLYTLVCIPDSAWSVAGLDGSQLLGKDDISAFWRGKGNMPAEGENSHVDAALDNALTLGNGNAAMGQYLLFEYDPETGTASVYARDANGEIIPVTIPGLTVTYEDGKLGFTVSVQTPSANENSSLTIQSQGVSLEKGSGGREYDYSNNIAASENTGSVEIRVETLTGKITASLSMHEDGMPNQYQLGQGQDPATGERDNSLENKYSEESGIPIAMQLVDGADGEYVHSITIGELPELSQGVLYYQGVPVTQGQVIELPEMNGTDIPGFSFKPAPNFSGNADFNFSYVIGSRNTGPSEISKDGKTAMHVDSVADLASGRSEFDGRDDNGNSIAMPGSTMEDSGWSVQTAQPEQSVDFTFTVNARFTDLDGSEIAWIEVELPQGFSIPPSSGYELVTRDGVNYAKIPVQDLTALQQSGGSTDISVTLRMNASAAESDKTLQIHIFTQETDQLGSGGHSTANNTAERVIEQEIPVSVHSGLTVKAGWASEGADGSKFGGSYDPSASAPQYAGATKGGAAAHIEFTLDSATPPLPDGSYSENIGNIVISYDASKGTLIGADGTPLSNQSIGMVTITLSGPDYIAADGQSLVQGSVMFRPAENTSDADLANVLSYEVHVSSASGEEAVYSGSTSIVIDAVADRPDAGSLNADYGNDGSNDYTAVTPGGVVPVSGSASFHDLDGSEVLYALLCIPDNAWSVAGIDNSQLLSKNDINAFWREAGNMPASGTNNHVDAALNNALTLGNGSAATSQYLLLEYDPETGTASVYARDANGDMAKVDIPGLTVSYADGTLSFTVPVQAPTASADTSLTVESQAVSLEKGSGGLEYDYSNNISASESTGSAEIHVKALSGKVTAELSMHEDGRPNQNQLARGQDPATGSRDNSLDPGYSDTLGMPVVMQLTGAEAGSYVYSITLSQLPNPITQGILYYNGQAVNVGQVISLPAMNGTSIPGFTFKPAPDFSGDLSLGFSYEIASTSSGPSMLTGTGTAPLHVDSVADLASGQSAFDGRSGYGDSIAMPGAAMDNAGWAVQTVQPEQGVDITFTVSAQFTDLDGSEIAWIEVELPQGFSIPPSSGYELITRNGVNYAKISVQNLTGLQQSGGNTDISVTLRMDTTTVDADKTLQIHIVTQETDQRNSNGHSTANNTAERVIEQEVPVSIHSGLTVKAGWASEGANGSKFGGSYNPDDSAAQYAGATEGGGAAHIEISLTSATPPLPDGSYSENISSIVITYDASKGVLLGANGAPLSSQASGLVTITLSGPDYIAADGQSLVQGSVMFRPAPNTSDADLTNTLNYEVHVSSANGEEAVYSGSTSIVIDAVADRPDTNSMNADYGGNGNNDYASATPGGVVNVSGSASFKDLDGSELLYTLVCIPDSAWSVAGLANARLLSKGDINAFWRDKGGMPAAGADSYVDASLNNALTLGNGSAAMSQYLLLEYDAETGVASVYARDANGNMTKVTIPGLTITYANGTLSYTLPVQTPSANTDAALTIQSQGVSLEKGTGGLEYDYSNNISASNGSGSVDVIVKPLQGQLTATVTLHEDGRAGQYLLGNGQDPATGSRDDSIEPGYSDTYGMPVVMQLTGADAGSYLHSITIGQLPNPVTQGVLYYNGQTVSAGQVISLPAMNGTSVPGFTFKPAPNFSGDLNFGFSYEIASTVSGPSMLTGSGSAPIHVDSVADLASGQSLFDGRQGSGNAISIPGAALDGEGWSVQTTQPEQFVDFSFTVRAQFTDLDGSEIAWLEIELPQGFSIPPSSGYELVTRNGVNYAKVPVQDLATLQQSGGGANISLTLRMDATASEADKTLQIHIFTQETDTRNSNGHSTANNTAERVIEQEIPVSVHSGLTVKAGWASESANGSKFGGNYNPDNSAVQYADATNGGSAANIDIALNSATPTLPGGAYSETISSIVITYDASKGTLIGADGNPLSSQTSGTVTITLSGSDYISTDGQSLVLGSVTFQPSQGTSDADLNNVLNYKVYVGSASGEQAVYSGTTSIVIDAVADRPDSGAMDVDYGKNVHGDAYLAVTPNSILPVNGSASFHDLDGSELLYTLICIPDSEWSVAGLDNSQLLSKNDIISHWRGMGNMPTAGADSYVDAALANAITLGDANAGMSQFLLLEYDPQTGSFSVFARDSGGNMVEVTLPNLSVSYVNGTINFSIPIQTPSAYADASLAIQSQPVSLEKGTGGTEYDYSNNISSSEAPSSTTIFVERILGTLKGQVSLHEDGMPYQNLVADGQPADTGPRNNTLETDYNPALGMPVDMTLRGADDGTYVTQIVIREIPDPVTQGTLYYNGTEVTLNQTINNPPMSDFNVPGFTFKPVPNFSGELHFDFDYTIASTIIGPSVQVGKDGSLAVHVDSVADLATARTESGSGVDQGNDFTASAPTVDRGWAEQSIDTVQTVDVSFTVKATFTDLDGSETAWILVALPQGFSIPAGSGYQAVTENGVNYAKIPLPALTTLQGLGGNIEVPVTLSMNSTAASGNKTLEVHVITQESDTLNSDGHTTANNTADRVLSQDVAMDVFTGQFTIKAGWTYEDNAHTNATQNLNQINLDPNSTVVSGAPIVIALDSGSTLTGLQITLNPSMGMLLLNGSPHPHSNGVFTFTQAQLQGGAIVFVPVSAHSDVDVPFSYVATVEDSRGSAFTVRGSSFVAVDSVADTGTITGNVLATANPDNTNMDIVVNAAFPDVDGSERHFILVEQQPGWTCNTPHEVVTIYVNAAGIPLQPTGYDSGTGTYTYDTSAGTPKTFFKIDVTGRSTSSGGAVTNYTVNMTPPAGAADTTLQIGSLAEERYGYSNDREYDVRNNQAFVLQNVPVNLLNSTLSVGTTGAYEDHQPNQHQGNTSTNSTDGVLTVTISNNGEYVDTSAGKTIVMTFSYAGPDDPGSFVYNGMTYTLGSANYVKLPSGQYQLTLPASVQAPDTSSFTVRYMPPADCDMDLTNISINVPVKSKNSGYTNNLTATTDRLIVDAVADKPEDVNLNPILNSPNTAAVTGSVIDVVVESTFGDYNDGSESHYLVFDLTGGFASIDLSSFPTGYTWTLLTSQQVQDAGLTKYTNTANYAVIQVPNDYLQANNGTFSNTIKATLDTVTQDRTLRLEITAVAVDTPTDSELSTNNNYSETSSSVNLVVHTITSVPVIQVAMAYENDTRQAHIGQDGSNGAPLSITGMHISEGLTDVTFSFADTAGTLLFNNVPINLGSNPIGNGLNLTLTIQGAQYTVSITGGSSTVDVAAQISKLSFVPSNNYSDSDVPMTISGTILDKASGETKSFTDNVTVVVDAVAQKPEAPGGEVTYEPDRTAAYDELNISAKATFFDTSDGSESHYLLVEAKSYLDTTGYTLITIAYDNQGNPLTPAASGTGWLNPNAASDVQITPAYTKTFIQIPVDGAISQYDTNGSVTQNIDGLSITRNANGSFTVEADLTIPIRTNIVSSDFSDTIITGGMAVESAVPPGSGDREGYRYNNVGYGLTPGVPVNVAVVETKAVSLLMGSAYEQNSPLAHTGFYGDGTGAGILVVRTTPDGQPDYADEQITITFTFNALYQDNNGDWVLPGEIQYLGQSIPHSVDQTTGIVTVSLIINTNDMDSILDSTAISSDPQIRTDQIDGSKIRFVPSGDTFNEGDLNLRYSISVEDTASGATLGMGNSAGNVVIDAVADKPTITGEGWDYGINPNTGQPYEAFATADVSLSFTATFPDTGTNGIFSEGQYILVQQIEGITLSQSFKDAVAAANMAIDVYPVGANLYYRIPAAFFTETSPGSHQYQVTIGLTRTTAVTDGTGYTAPEIMAMALVRTPHGSEPVVSNNVATTHVPLPPLDFAVVDTHLPTGGSSVVYENDTKDAHIGDLTQGDGVQFSLGLQLGSSINNDLETASDITFTYADNRGTLYYSSDGGNTWTAVASGSTVPSAYSDKLKYVPKNTHDSTADIDVPLNYSVTVSDPASGASKTLNGSYLIIVDAVAVKPALVNISPPVYSDENHSGTLGYNESVTLDVTANFPDYDKVAGGHSDLYILIQKPGAAWTTSYSGATEYIYNGVSYFRIPVSLSDLDPGVPGNATVSVTLHAPNSGYLLFNNSAPLSVYALTIARDPNKGPLTSGDRGETYDNNWAYSEGGDVRLTYDTGGNKFFTVDPLYQNNNPDGNLLDSNGNPVVNEVGGKVHLQDTYVEQDGTSHTVNSVTVHWTESDGDLYINGQKVTPTQDGNGQVSYTIDPGDFDNVEFRTTNPNSDKDFNPVTVDIHTDAGDFTDSFTPIIDAVAQVPTNVESETDYNIGSSPTHNTAAVPGDIAHIKVSAQFYDLDSSEEHYVLIENDPNWENMSGFPTINGPDGKQYIQIPVTVDPATGIGSAIVALKTPETGGADLGDGKQGFTLQTGAMSVQKPLPAPDQEYRSDNNVAYNLNGTVEVVTSRAESSPTLHVTNTYANGDVDGDGVPDAGNNSNIYITGIDTASDTIDKVTITYSNTNGDIYYNGTALSSGTLPGVVVVPDGNGNVTLTISDSGIINALTSGSAASSQVQYVSNNYIHDSVPIQAQISVQDNFSSDAKVVNSTPTILVDAVARRPENVNAQIVDPDFNGSVQAGTSVTFQVTASFPDMDIPGVSGNHYLAVQQVDGWSPSGSLPIGVTTQTYDGVTYYLINADDYRPGSGQTSPALTYDPDTGIYTFTLKLTSPASAHDVQNTATVKGGALTTIDVPNDLDLKNNLNLVANDIVLNIGVVETTKVDFIFSPIVEDEIAGSAITLSTDTLNNLTTNNEKVTETDLTFTGNFSGKGSGEVVGTIIYDGKAYPVTSTGNGTTASVHVDFGTDGYDPSKSFKMVWGTVQTNPDGTMVTDPSGNPVVTDWNHTGANMTVSASSTVVDRASNDAQTGVTGSGNAPFTPTADAPTDITAGTPDPAGADSPVSFSLTGTFADIDGSEQHYFLVEQKTGWSGNYQTISHNGVTYFMVPAGSNTAANPTVTVNLTSPSDITADQTIPLKTGGLSYDGDSTAFSEGPDVSVTIGVVEATGVSMTMADTDEDVPSQIIFSLQGGNNESIQSITITDLQGGSLVDASGNTLFASSQLPATLDMSLVASNGYYYKPPAYTSGDFTLGFNAVAKDDASGVTQSFTDLAGPVTINPVTNVPENASGAVGAPENEPGHTASLDVNLSASFVDNDGSEEHFFLVTLPQGVTAPTGWSPLTDAKLLAAAGLTGQTAYKVSAGSSGTASFTLTLPQNFTGGSLAYKAGSVESATLGNATPDYQFMDGQQLTIPVTSAINVAPTVANATGAMADALRDPGQVVTGQLSTGDADGDTVTVSSLTHDGIQGTESNGQISVAGTYGTLHVDTQTGAYSYDLGNAMPPNAFPEVFRVTVSDGHGGTATANITITLNAPNTAPESNQFTEDAGGVGGGLVNGNIPMVDPENDPVSITGVQVNGTDVAAGAGGVYTQAGTYGTFEIQPDGSYTYTLTDTNATGVDVLTVKLSDSFGASSSSIVTVNVTPEAGGRIFPLSSLLESESWEDNYFFPDEGAVASKLQALGAWAPDGELSFPERSLDASLAAHGKNTAMALDTPEDSLDGYLAGMGSTYLHANSSWNPSSENSAAFSQMNSMADAGDGLQARHAATINLYSESIEDAAYAARINLELLS